MNSLVKVFSLTKVSHITDTACGWAGCCHAGCKLKRDGNLGREPLIQLLCILAAAGHRQTDRRRLALKTNAEWNGPTDGTKEGEV